MAKNFAAGTRWLPGKIIKLEGNTMVKIELDDGRIWRRHMDHIIRTTLTIDEDNEYDPSTMPWDSDSSNNANPQELPNNEEVPINNEEISTNNEELLREETPEQINTGQMGGVRETRHSTRTRPTINRYVPTSK